MLFGIGLMFIWIGYTTYLRFQPFKFPIIRTDPMPILNPNHQLKTSESLRYQLDYCTFAKVLTTNTRAIEEVGGSQRIYFLITTTSESKVGCGIVEINMPLSSDIQPGRYRLKSVGVYKVNAFKEETKTFYSEEFEII